MSSLLEQLPPRHSNRYIKDQLLYFRELFRDATTSTLADTKACHRRVLEALEKGEVDPSNWQDWNNRRKEVLSRMHRNGPSNKTNRAKTSPTTTTNKTSKRSRPCLHWNKNMCDRGTEDHETTTVIWMHVCSFCFAAGNKYKHKENVTKRIQKLPRGLIRDCKTVQSTTLVCKSS